MEFEDSESFFPLISEENILMTPPRESESGNFVGRDNLLYFMNSLITCFWFHFCYGHVLNFLLNFLQIS